MAVIVEDLALNFGGKLKYTKFTVDYATIAAIIGAATSGNIPLFSLPNFSLVMGIIVKHTVQFAGVGGTLKVSVGTTGTATQLTAATADLVATAVANTAYQKTNTPDIGAETSGGTNVSVGVVLNVVSSVGNLTLLTAGSVDIYVLYASVSTPTP